MARAGNRRFIVALGAALVLSGCQLVSPKLAGDQNGTPATADYQKAVKLVDRDVEAPEIFHVKTQGLWDGRPSLGGVWVAYPNIKEPERVIIRNPANGKFVIGALFRRETTTPGPKLQISSDTATALGLLAGQPVELDVTALRRVETPTPEVNPKQPLLTVNQSIRPKPAPYDKATTASQKGAATKPSAAPAAATKQTPAAATDHSAAEFLQVGIFSVEANAQRTAAEFRRNGVIPTITKETSQGKTFWRVMIGPMTTPADRRAILAKAHALNFKDAYFVSK